MTELEKKMIESLSIDHNKETIDGLFTSSVGIATMIADYAHKYQTRENGNTYLVHPHRMLHQYRIMMGIDVNNFDIDECYKHDIPFWGVQEVCLLHDVVEDTEITLEEIKQVYIDHDLEKYFKMYMEVPLRLITHDKSEEYIAYLAKVIQHPISALVKLLDLNDNLGIFDLAEINNEKLDRMHRYVEYIGFIDHYYDFIKKIYEYSQVIENYVLKNS